MENLIKLNLQELTRKEEVNISGGCDCDSPAGEAGYQAGKAFNALITLISLVKSIR